MTAEEFWRSWLAIWILAGPFLLAITGSAYSLYLSHRHMEAIKEALKNSRYIYIWGTSLGKRGWIWSLLEIAKIAGMITMPKAYIRLGDLDPIDLENFPRRLKLRLQIVTMIMLGGAIWLVGVSVLLELE